MLEQVFNFHCHITCDIVYVCVYSCAEILLLIKFRIYKIHYVIDHPLRNFDEFYLSLLVMRGIVVALLVLLDVLLDELEIRPCPLFHGLSFAFND